mgnify:CR=1 FL=1
MTRWKSAMPLTFGPRRATETPAGGLHDMPDGVYPPEVMARSVVADGRLARAEKWARHQRAGCVVTIAGTEVGAQEIRERERLFAGARKGDKAAIEELWATRRAWIITGGGKAVTGERMPPPGRGVGDGPAVHNEQEA